MFRFRFWKTLALVSVFLLSAIVAHAAWSEPQCGPTDCNTEAPLNVSSVVQYKVGGLNLGSTQITLGNLLLRVAGRVGADQYCDKNGQNCFAPTSGGLGGPWSEDAATNSIFPKTLTRKVGIGTNAPGGKLDVFDTGNVSANVRSQSGQASVGIRGGAPFGWALIQRPTGEFSIWRGPVGDAAAGNKFNILPNGNVGINTITPNDFRLQIGGHTGPDADNTFNLGSPTKRWANLYASNIYTCSGPGSCSPITGGGGIDSNWGTSTSAAGVNIYNKNNGNVGVGVTMPPSKFSVRGGATSLDGGLAVFGASSLNGNTSVVGNLSLKNTNYLDLGMDVSGRAWSTGPGTAYPISGVARYTTAAPSPLGNRHALDILGGGVSGSNRLVRLMDHVYIPGNICNGNGTVCSTIENIINNRGGSGGVWATTTQSGVESVYRATGNVGVGTNNPLYRFHIKTGTNQNLGIGSTQGVVNITAANDANNQAVPLNIYGSKVSFVGGGNVGFGTDNPSDFKIQSAGNIGPNVDNTYDLGSATKKWKNLFASNIYGDKICTISGVCIDITSIGGDSFWTPAGAGNIKTDAAVTGNVGIGLGDKETPSTKLHVAGDTFIASKLKVGGTSGVESGYTGEVAGKLVVGAQGNSGHIAFRRSGEGWRTASYGIASDNNGEVRAENTTGGGFYTWFLNTAGGVNERMRLNADGLTVMNGLTINNPSNLAGINIKTWSFDPWVIYQARENGEDFVTKRRSLSFYTKSGSTVLSLNSTNASDPTGLGENNKVSVRGRLQVTGGSPQYGKVLAAIDEMGNTEWKASVITARFQKDRPAWPAVNSTFNKHPGDVNGITYSVDERYGSPGCWGGCRDWLVMQCPADYRAVSGGVECEAGAGEISSTVQSWDDPRDWRVSCGTALGRIRSASVSCALGAAND